MTKEKPVNRRLLESLAKWESGKKRPTVAVQRDVRIMVLNGVCMAYHRKQFFSSIMVFAEYDSMSGEYSIFFREAQQAAEEIAEFLRSQACSCAVNPGFKEGENGRPVITLTVETGGIAGPVAGINQENIKAIRRRHWQERAIRAKKEGGPRKRKTKKRGKRKK